VMKTGLSWGSNGNFLPGTLALPSRKARPRFPRPANQIDLPPKTRWERYGESIDALKLLLEAKLRRKGAHCCGISQCVTDTYSESSASISRSLRSSLIRPRRFFSAMRESFDPTEGLVAFRSFLGISA